MGQFLLFFVLTVCACKTKKGNIVSLNELLIKERTQYLNVYRAGIKMFRDSSFVLEPLLEVRTEESKNLPDICRLYRYDLMVKTNSNLSPTEFNIHKDSLLKFELQEFEIDGMTVSISPFVWNGCEFHIDRNIYYGDIYNAWSEKWIDAKDVKKENADGFKNVIHSITCPKQINGNSVFSVDFGTAPTNAFIDLLRQLAKLGIQEVEVNSNSFR